MAAAIATVTVPSDNFTYTMGNLLSVIGTITIQPAPATYTTGGIACSFAQDLVKAQRPPLLVDISVSVNGNLYTFIPGTTVANGLLKIFTAVGAELGNGVVIPATNSSDTISFQAWFLGQL